VRISFRAAWPRLATLSVATLGVAGIVVFGSGEKPQAVRLLSGSAWLPSGKAGQITLLDGSSTEVAAQLQVASPGDNLDVVQHGSTAYAIDRTLGTIRRIDGATYEMSTPESPVADARSGLTAFAASDAVYAIDTKRGVLNTADPRTLKPRGEPISLSTDLTPGSAAVDDAGRLWLVDSATGELNWIDHKRNSRRDVTSPGHSVVAIANGQPVIINTNTRKATTVDAATGQPGDTFDLSLRPNDTVSVSGSPHTNHVYLVASRGVLIICDTTANKCDDVVPLNEGSLGTPVEAGNRVFVPDYSAGQVWIVDLANRSVVAKPQILMPRTQFQLLNRDGVVFFNDPDSDKAGVIQLNGQFAQIAKYDPASPSKGVTNLSPDDHALPPQNPQQTPVNPPPDTNPGNPQQPPASSSTQQPPISTPPAPPPSSSEQPQPPPSSPPNQPPPNEPPKPPVLKITLSKTTPMVDEDITLQVSADTNVVPAHAQWDFGDNQSGATVTTSHHWTVARVYQVSVQVTMPDGQHATTSLSLPVSAKPTAKLTITPPAQGTITSATPAVTCPATCTVVVDKGQSVTLTATPAANYRFGGWAGACTGTGACTVLLNANKTVSATFTAISPVEQFIGNWKNVDPNTGGIAKVTLTAASAATATLHAYGACGGGFCDWGNTTATLTGNQMHAFYDQGFATQTLTLKIVNGELVITDFCNFQPPDTRTDFTEVDTFGKSG
jgi:hypothetical protein